MSKKVPHKSQFELMKFLKENPDPLGIEKSGGLKEYTLEEVAKHNAPPSVWSIYKGNVYDNVSPLSEQLVSEKLIKAVMLHEKRLVEPLGHKIFVDIK